MKSNQTKLDDLRIEMEKVQEEVVRKAEEREVDVMRIHVEQLREARKASTKAKKDYEECMKDVTTKTEETKEAK